MTDLPIGGGRLYELMRTGRFVLLDAAAAHAAAAPLRDRVDAVRADRPTPYGAATTLLIRPGGYLAWTGVHPDPRHLRKTLRL